MRLNEVFAVLCLCALVFSGAVSGLSGAGGANYALGYPVMQVQNQCPNVDGEISKCKSQGMGYEKSVDNSGCVQITCVAPTTTTAATLPGALIRGPTVSVKPACQTQDEVRRVMDECYKKSGEGYYTAQYTDQNGCNVVTCVKGTTTTTQGTQCPDESGAIKDCQAKGMGYTRYVSGSCVMIQCTQTTTTTPTSDCPDVQSQMEDCKLKGGQISRRYDDNKCIVIDCALPTNNCPSGQVIEQMMKDCKAKNLDYVTYEKGGCRYVECVQETDCPSEADLDYAIRKCKAAGMDYQTYADGKGCRQVRCIEQTPCPSEDENKRRIEECKKKGNGYRLVPTGAAVSYTTAYIPCYKVECVDENPVCPSIKDDMEVCRKQGLDVEYYVDENKCERARCVKKPDGCRPNCPTEDELKDMILKCEANGMGYEFYTGTPAYASTAAQTSESCRRVRCVEKACPSGAELGRMAKDCAGKKLQAQAYEDENGCKNIRCTEAGDCPPYEVTDEIVRSCREKKLDVESYIDEKGCKNVRCKEPESVPTVECRKYLKGNCVIITCTDGYYFDSCKPGDVCREVECKIYKEKDCTVKRCSDGYEARDCPKPDKNVECKIYTREDGCEVKKCTDGEEYVSCPANQGCVEYYNDKKCKVVECEGYTETTCPDGTKTVCKRYKNPAGCIVVECDNGFESNSCGEDLTDCKQEKDGDCVVTKCKDGTESRKCPDKQPDCETYVEESGCKLTVCTDGSKTRTCPPTYAGKPSDAAQATGLSTTTTTLKKGVEGGWLSSFFRSLGL